MPRINRKIGASQNHDENIIKEAVEEGFEYNIQSNKIVLKKGNVRFFAYYGSSKFSAITSIATQYLDWRLSK